MEGHALLSGRSSFCSSCRSKFRFEVTLSFLKYAPSILKVKSSILKDGVLDFDPSYISL